MSKTRGSSVTATNLDQLVFRPGGGHGPQVLASSFETPASGEDWARALEPYLRRAGASADPQTPVLSYVRYPDGQAAVCRRRADPRGEATHCLVGLATDLTAPLAVGLSLWPAELDAAAERGRMPQLTAGLLSPDQHAAAALRSTALDHDEQLARVLAWMLQAPARPLAVLGCAAGARPALLWGLVHIALPLFEQRVWTFTTGDIAGEDAADPLLPEIVFLAERPDDALRLRTVVDLTQDQGASPENEYRANALVFRYEFGHDPGAAAPVAVAPISAAVSTGGPAPVSAGPLVPSAGPPSTNGTHTLPPAPVAAAVVPPQGGGPPIGEPAGTRHWDTLRAAVDRLATATSRRRVEAGLDAVARQLQRPDDRAVVRAGLANHRWGVDAVRRAYPEEERDAVLERIVRLAFGDRVDDIAEAERTVRDVPSDELVRAIARVAWPSGRLDALAPSLGGRWLRATGPEGPGPGPLGRLAGLLGIPLTRQHEHLVLAVLVLVAVVAAFLLGAIVGPVDPFAPEGWR